MSRQTNGQSPKKQKNTPEIPDIDIINLDSIEEPDDAVFNEMQKEGPSQKKAFSPRSLLNVHTAFFAIVIICIAVIVIRFRNWGTWIDLDEIFKDGKGTYNDTLDMILPAPSPDNSAAVDDDVTTILCFGNAPFADDRDSEDNLANIIAEETGAVVYNCSVPGSYLAAQRVPFDSSAAPMDAYTLYWLSHLAVSGVNNHMYSEAARELGSGLPQEAEYVRDTLLQLDLNTVDIITIMYDATDYLMGHDMYNDDNDEDITQFTGNLEASISLIHSEYPHIRFIVLSPTYAFAVNEEGEYVSSDMYRYGKQDVLSTYVIKQYGSCASLSVSFIDNLYGTITEDNAAEYLTDNLHLNVAGRRLVARRFVDALSRYQDN